MKSWLTRITENTVLRGRVRGRAPSQRATPWSRWFPETPTVDPARFQGPDEPYPGHWRSAPAPWPTDPAADQRAREQLHRAIGELPGPWRLVLEARDVRGLTPADTAGELDIPPEEQLPLLHRARAAIRERLAAYYDRGAHRRGTRR